MEWNQIVLGLALCKSCLLNLLTNQMWWFVDYCLYTNQQYLLWYSEVIGFLFFDCLSVWSYIFIISFEKLLFSWPDPKEMRYFHHFAFFVVVCKLFSFWFSFPKLLGEFKPSLMRMFIGWSSTKKSFNNIFSWSERHNRIKLANRPFAVFSSTNPEGQMSFFGITEHKFVHKCC